MPLTNLREEYGFKYRVVDDGTDDPVREERPGCQEIPGKHGAIYPYGHDGSLAARFHSKTRGKTDAWAKRFQKEGFPIIQRGDWEIVFKFPSDQIHRFADLIKAKKRWHLNPEQKIKALAALVKARKKRPPEPPLP